MLDDCLLPYIVSVEVYDVSSSERVDHALVTVLVKQWRQETHTFHLPVGEATVTLQDVVLFLGLRIDGRAVTFPPCNDWWAACTELLGITSDDRALDGGGLRLRWLHRHFQNGLPPYATGMDSVSMPRRIS